MAQQTTAEQRQKFQNLLAKAQAEFEQDPDKYQKRIFRLALLGYGVLLGLFALLLILLGGSIWLAFVSPLFLALLLKKKLIIVLGIVIYVIAKALWIKLEPPQGRELSREEAPQLYAVIDELQEKLDTPPIHRVVIDQDLNAAMSQVPRFGPIGNNVNSLVLGLPLLMNMSPEQAKSVIAHELGHLSGNHSRFSAWVYRMRTSWMRVMEEMDKHSGWATGWLVRFFDWYAPYFQAYSFPLARANEYEADAVAAQITSPKHSGSALVQAHVGGGMAENLFWDNINKEVEQHPKAPPQLHARLNQFLKAPGLDRGKLQTTLEKVMQMDTDSTDTHPSLQDRLQALGVTAEIPEAIAQNAAEVWLGDSLNTLLNEFDESWLAHNGEVWEQRHEQIKESRQRLETLCEKDSTELDTQELWDIASLTEQFDQDSDPLPLYQAYRERCPEDQDVFYVIGRILLDRDDPTGLDYLEKVLGNLQLTKQACEMAAGYLMSKQQDYSIWQQRWDEQNDREVAANAERAEVTIYNKFLNPEFTEDTLETLRRQLAQNNKIKHAWVALKQLEHYPEQPVCVLLVGKSGLFTDSDTLVEWMVENVEVPCLTHFKVDDRDNSELGKLLKTVAQQVM